MSHPRFVKDLGSAQRESLAIAIENNTYAGIAVAVAIVAASALIRGLFLGELGTRVAFITFYPAVAVAALFGGLWAGLIATFLSAALADYFWIAPAGSFVVPEPVDRLSLGIFFISASIISWTAEQRRLANRRVRQADAARREEVELLVGQRTAQLVEAADALQSEISRRRGFEERSRMVIESAPTAMIMIDDMGVIELVNARAEQTFGFPRDKMLGQNIDTLLPRRFRNGHSHHRDAFIAAPTQRAMGIGHELFALREDGGELPVEIGLSPLSTSDGLKVIASVVDISQRRQMERALIESEQRSRLMFDNIRDNAIIMLDADGYVVNWNAGAERLKGYNRQEVIGRHFSLFYSPEDVADEKPERKLIVAAREGRVEDEGWRVRKDGSRFLANVSINAVKNAKGDLQGFVKVTRDITDRRKIENELIEANVRFALAAEAAGLGFWDADIDARTARWDDQMFKLYGVDRQAGEEPYDLWAKYLHLDDRARAEQDVGDAIAGRGAFDTEFRIVRPDGEVRQLRAAASVKRDSASGGTRMFGVNFDITDRKKIENELIEANERFRLAAEAAGLGYWEYEFDTQAVRWDAQLFRLHGIAAVEGTQSFAIRASQVHPVDRPSLDAAFADAVAGLRRFELQYRIVWPDGRVRHLKSAASLERDPTGGASRFLGVSFDVTELEEARSSLEQARDAAETANRAKSAFLASMSHEIRTPMNGVIGFADLLLDGELTEQQRNYTVRLRDAAKSLLSLMNDILDLSKIEAGKLEVETIPTNPRSVVHGAVSVVRAQMAAKGLDVRFEIAGDAPGWIEGDPTRLRQILLNLLSNALKFTDRGRITVRCSRQSVAREDILRFEVEDTGIGIPADRHHLLFRDFSQVDSSTTRRYGGTGLGLSICKRLAQAMGGEIGVESVPGEGSTIWFTIALRACEAPDLSSTSDPTAMVVTPARVLVADDLEMNRDIVEAMLRRAGHSVRGVDNGRQAVIAVQESDFDVVLMDMEMPEMDGIAATRAIRRLDERIRLIPIVALTANAFSEDQQRCRAAGMNDFLPKPIDGDALLAVVAKWSGGPPSALTETKPATSLVLDPAVLAALDGALGVEEAARISEKFRSRVGDSIAVLTSAEQPAVIAREAHKLIGLAGNLGCLELAGIARDLCSEARRENGDVRGILIALAAAVDRAVAALAARYP